MPPKQRITREMILERAFDMFCREGMEVVNARSVAKALGCSTQPIFSYYTGMQDLRTALDLKAQDLFTAEVLEIEKGESWFMDLCEAFVRFACKYPHIYRHLYQSACEDKERLSTLCPLGAPITAHICEKACISEDSAKAAFNRMLVYCVGLASVSIIGVCDINNTRSVIEKAYSDAIAAAR